MLGVIIGILLLLLMTALVVLQGMIEWGNFDADKLFKKKTTVPEAKEKPAKKAKKKAAKKPSKKPAKKAKKPKKKGKGKK